jgi:hypothetical protein
MNPWLIFLAGFIAFPALVILAMLALGRLGRVHPVVVNDSVGLQAELRDLLQYAGNRSTLYLMDYATRAVLRVIKHSRTRSDDTLAVEVRRTETTQWYEAMRTVLVANEVSFEEDLTPKRRQPRRLKVRDRHGGLLAVSSIAAVIETILDALPSKGALHLLVSERSPDLWIIPR